LIIRRLIVPLTVALMTAHAGQVLAQIANDPAFPPVRGAATPPANDPAFPPVKSVGTANDPAFPPLRGAAAANDPAFPPVNGSAPARSSFPVNGAAPLAGAGFGPAPAPEPQSVAQMQECMKQFLPLRQDAEKKGKMIKAASDRHATADVACKLIKNYGAAESKMMAYVEKNSAKCGIPAQIGDQLKNGHKNTETMLEKVCGAAAQAQTSAPAGPSLSEVLGSATALPEATKTKKGGSAFDTLTGNVLTR
jgi:hypothetical protein